MTENKTQRHEALSDDMNNLQEGAKGFRKNLLKPFTGPCHIIFQPITPAGVEWRKVLQILAK